MPRNSLIVLKCGGSVLRGTEDLRRAVHEVQRWRRTGTAVVVVVSAEHGRTAALLERAGPAQVPTDDLPTAALVATGEQASVASWVLELERAGIPAHGCSPAELGIRVEGPALDASPVRVDPRGIRAILERDEVVVAPGFVGLDAAGRPRLLGRGGSDLTALVLARALGADACRLVKDVDGLFTSDPAREGVPPDRFATVTYEDAGQLDDTILQPKALAYARAHDIPFEVAAWDAVVPTHVGASGTKVVEPDASAPRLRVGVLGCGAVGTEVVRELQRLDDRFSLARVAVRDVDRQRAVHLPEGMWTAEPAAALADVDVVVEVLGGVVEASGWIERALRAGVHVVTANKAVLARHGRRLEAIAEARGVRLLGSASVGGNVPVLERLRLRPRSVRRLRGVLNGTAGFVLEAVASGQDLPAALAEARAWGLAEHDPSRDLDGIDAAEKLVVLAACLGHELELEEVVRDRWSDDLVGRAHAAAAIGAGLRQVASLTVVAGRPVAEVRYQVVDPGDPLVELRGATNAIEVLASDGVRQVWRGLGAGGRPTATAVLGDLGELRRAHALPGARPTAASARAI